MKASMITLLAIVLAVMSSVSADKQDYYHSYWTQPAVLYPSPTPLQAPLLGGALGGALGGFNLQDPKTLLRKFYCYIIRA